MARRTSSRRTSSRRTSSRRRQPAMRHPLLIYRNLGKRYLPPGILLMLLGGLALLPSAIEDLETDLLEADALALLGDGLIVAGAGFLLFAWHVMRRAFVRADPQMLIVQTPFYRVKLSYRRIKMAHAVKVANIFPHDELNGLGKPLMSPLLNMTAVEIHVQSWPVSKARLRRFVGRYLLSPQSEAWVLIVPNYSVLMHQIDTAAQRWREAKRGQSTTYRDPISRVDPFKF